MSAAPLPLLSKPGANPPGPECEKRQAFPWVHLFSPHLMQATLLRSVLPLLLFLPLPPPFLPLRFCMAAAAGCVVTSGS